MEYLDLDIKDLESARAFWTAKEIQQQPECWRKTSAIVSECRQASQTFLAPLLAKKDLRIVMTGAGTSAFAGRALAPALTKVLSRRVEAVASTDIVSNPYQYFAEDIPTLVVSFARSGNSPESVAAVDLANQVLSNCYHLVVTCNGEGELYRRSCNDAKTFAILMPEETNDKSFAMTSSFSSMMLATFAVLCGENDYTKEIESLCKHSEALIKEINHPISKIASNNAKRVVYLGSGCLQGLAQEAALKLLELTAGKVVAMFDSPLGFRHGPKSIVDDETLVFVFISSHPYTRQYDLDLLSELRRDKIANQVIAVTSILDEVVTDGEYITIAGMEEASDIELLFPYIIIAQLYAFHYSLALGNTPDNPCPTGEVNRVVQGVTIHELF